MKSTQTKLFDFSDTGLDFCSGSRALFPDRFKKMLSLGYNVQTVTNVAVAGNQVTFSYGGAHGYAADRVLKVDSGALASINSGEFWIDSVTTNTVTFTLDDAPTSVAGGFTTRIASLGWELVYELNHIHIYKFKHIDDTDMYARFCFQNATATGHRNCIAVGIGRTVNLSSGIITDPNCLDDLATCETVLAATSNLRWDFTAATARTWDNYTYSQGFSTFGKGCVIGSVYHIACAFSIASSTNAASNITGIFPFSSDYDVINYPVNLGTDNGLSNTTATITVLGVLRAYAGKQRCAFSSNSNASYPVFSPIIGVSSFLPDNIDSFNTTSTLPLFAMTFNEKQVLGYVHGLYQAVYVSSNMPPIGTGVVPVTTYEIDFSNKVITQPIAQNSSSMAWVAIPIEDIKIA